MAEDTAEQRPAEGLLSWITGKLDPWRTHRDSVHKKDWDEYYRIWRGIWDAQDKTRSSERSKIISPATMSAVDSAVSEIEEAIFGREQWFELEEDIDEIEDPRQKDEMIHARDLFREKLEKYDVPAAMSSSFLIGAITGTGIAKINTTVKTEDYGEGKRDVVCVELLPIEPHQFIPDPSTERIEDMLGCAHETLMPIHIVKQMQKDGVYFRDVDVAPYDGPEMQQINRSVVSAKTPMGDACLITEWHGKVPARYLLPYMPNLPSDEALFEADESLVEAIVTILNKGQILGAKPNPFKNQDRCFVSFQFDSVPGYFWGRGIPEKAYHAQKSLDHTLRTRMDAQGLVAHPMIGGDVTRLPKGFNLGVWPGKFWATTGSPSEVLQGFNLGQVNPALFENAADLERMLQTATGAMDPGISMNTNGATDRGMAASAFIKRSRKAMQNIERRFIRPLINKMFKRYVQFDSTEFPQDYEFRVKGTMGIMAREIEQQQLTQLLSLVPNESKPFFMIAKAVFDNSSSPHKGEISRAIDEWINPEPDPQAQQMQQQMQELQMRGAVAEVAEKEAKAQKAQAEAQFAATRAAKTAKETTLLDANLMQEQVSNAIDLREVEAFEAQNMMSQQTIKLRAVELAIKALEAQAKILKIKQDAEKLSE
ncbi:MAG: hypothetical protein AB7Q37_18650 [Pyrinomonadaceae bacterium]